jgi:hypothetical protein
MRVKRFIFVLVYFALCLGVSVGQDYRATVQGLVTDSSEAIVVAAKVTLLNVNTGIAGTRETNNIGHYRFDFVEPGTYSVSAEMAGFNKSVQENVLVQTRADVTVNFSLKPGAVNESITVNATAVALQFNTSTKELTVDRKQLMELPVMQRNPFSLAMLDPAVQDQYGIDRNPYFMWASSTINIGGRNARQNDLLIDGAPVQVGPKGSYTPTMDAVQEFSIQQNSVDAEFGHSAGGILSLSMREGTNEIHGTAYYFGRNPALNAATNAITHTPSTIRNHNWGGTAGGPIRKNRLFTFFSYEAWRTKDPMTSYYTLPTDLERTGDFSKSLNADGNLRTIYDPNTTVFDSANNVATRQPFPGNAIPKDQQDPTAVKMMQLIWGPNNAGDNSFTGANNFKASYSGEVKYWNFSNRTDWNVSEKLRVFGRYSRFHTALDQADYTPNHSIAMTNGRGGLMESRNIAGDAVYTINPTTVFNARFSYVGFADNYDAPAQKIGQQGLAQFWPQNPWYQPYSAPIKDVYFPSLTIGDNGFGMGWYWVQEPHNYNLSAKLSKNAGRHNLKFGYEGRLQREYGIYPNLMGFTFTPGMTANTFLSPNTRLSGDAWATFLLGALTDSSYASYSPDQNLAMNYHALFFQDDLKLNRNVTLNLGLRYEYESAPTDSKDRYTRQLDLTQPIPEMQANPPAIPDWINQMRGKPAVFNGAWIFADSNHRAQYNAKAFNLSPRAGVAIRVNDRMAVQAGYARYMVAPSTVQDGIIAGQNFAGFSAWTSELPAIAGIPGGKLSDPFPSGENPLQPLVGKTLGRYTNLGNGGSWHQFNYRNGVNDRFNFTLQRELPMKFKADVTWFMTFGHDLDYSVNWDDRPVNMAYPNLTYTLKGAVYDSVPNPFFNYLTPDKFPGQLRNRDTVSVLELLRTYPQYGDLYLQHTTGMRQRYKALQMRVQRGYSNGLSLLWAYNYSLPKLTYFPNDLAWYAFQSSWRNDAYPRHRMTVAGTYDLPFGKGRPFLSQANPAVNAIFGGWSTSSLMQIMSGSFLMFWGDIVETGDPSISNPTKERRFNTQAFSPLPAFTPRTAPISYPGVQNPRTWSLDTTLSKTFPIRERLNLEVRAEAYNLTNSLIWGNTNNNIYSSLFGRCTGQVNRGREMQYTARLIF